jgi:adenosylmethionine-8-amino-7-oxononanoate aminotransferase
VVVLMPPLAISEADLRRLLTITAGAIEAATAAAEAAPARAA